ncbi:hypothetical protein [Mesorhizobium sp.]|uniref:hypothetical protein n=1 Tax=Mesorhizobium sp. TaxID=1871066 RepID=UPI000FE58805|nr:hypothetical protein [Mesorhizobium sp.]RWM26410.1 MAG: hypothetical protein EOR74_15725 [Mesorhizobium sp.]RWM37298.1 MAG: hypothetical protein EOR75_20525 [Mesorhizobium sp.]TIO76770.1 MAG: hypothetical protein E5X75_13040 [Mesorhizobium sp.]TIO83034.1 MAG: hypothetical protein E5X74_22060 [Mesorhizobium sp.]TJV50817.1 MAG: hypothetical protein E5Y01_17240 [Mesorhizobium sp.]
MRKGLIGAVGCLLLLSQKAFAGWYQVENYEGSIGPNPVHLSLQRYASFGSGITVEGSYFYDAKQSPIAIYGKADGPELTLCEIADDKEFQRIVVMGSKTPVDTTGCPLFLDLSESGATGTWSKGADKFPVTLKKVASLDDTGEGRIAGTVEIPFWAETATDRFAGIYATSDAGICMTKLQIINKKKKKVVQEIGFDDEDCNAGMSTTPIYMNVEKWVQGGKDIISVNFGGGKFAGADDYVFNPKTKKYHLKK